MIKYLSPKITLLNKNDNFNQNYELWLKSREAVISRDNGKLFVGKELVSDENQYKTRIIDMGLQYNNFPTYELEIQGSVLFRDILFSINKIAQWATSLRFTHSLHGDDVTEDSFPISSEYRGIIEWERQFDQFMRKVSETKITDENRLEMPFSMSSKYWVAINHKTLVAFLSMLKLKMPFFYEIYGALIVNEIQENASINMREYLVPYVDDTLSQYFSRSEFNESYRNVDDLVILKIKMGLLLFSQFLRQSDVVIKGFYDVLVHESIEIFKHKMFYAGTELDVTYIADKMKFMRTISNRTCWFSMSSGNGINSWSNILDLVLKDMGVEDFMRLLPCKFVDNKLCDCKYKDDVKFRDEGLEKRNLPCAILNNSLEIASKRNEHDRTLLSNLYLETVNMMKGAKI